MENSTHLSSSSRKRPNPPEECAQTELKPTKRSKIADAAKPLPITESNKEKGKKNKKTTKERKIRPLTLDMVSLAVEENSPHCWQPDQDESWQPWTENQVLGWGKDVWMMIVDMLLDGLKVPGLLFGQRLHGVACLASTCKPLHSWIRAYINRSDGQIWLKPFMRFLLSSNQPDLFICEGLRAQLVSCCRQNVELPANCRVQPKLLRRWDLGFSLSEIIRFLYPCDRCPRLTKTRAAAEHHLREADLLLLPFENTDNPHYARAAPLHLIPECAVKRLHRKLHPANLCLCRRRGIAADPCSDQEKARVWGPAERERFVLRHVSEWNDDVLLAQVKWLIDQGNGLPAKDRRRRAAHKVHRVLSRLDPSPDQNIEETGNEQTKEKRPTKKMQKERELQQFRRTMWRLRWVDESCLGVFYEFMFASAGVHLLPADLEHFGESPLQPLFGPGEIPPELIEKYQVMQQSNSAAIQQGGGEQETKAEQFMARFVISLWAPSFRYEALVRALGDRGLVLRSDSQLCQNYIKGSAQTLEECVAVMEEMRWFFNRTDYARRQKAIRASLASKSLPAEHTGGKELGDWGILNTIKRKMECREWVTNEEVSEAAKGLALKKWWINRNVASIEKLKDGELPRLVWQRLQKYLGAAASCS